MYRTFEPLVRAAVAEVWGDRDLRVTRVTNDPRDRLAVDVRIEATPD